VVNLINLPLSIYLYASAALRRVPKDSLLSVEVLRQSVHTSSQGPYPPTDPTGTWGRTNGRP